MTNSVRLTQFSHGGGCGCKIAPAVLEKLLASAPQGIVPPALLVGTATADDAAVYQLNPQQAIVATTDFFTPIVDDPYDFGRIAATNALSDVYAMGGQPLFALALVGMPLDKLTPEVIGQVLAGGAKVCADAGIPIAGGHSIDVLEPIYGLVGIGVLNPTQLKTNAGGKPGDVLVLTKPLGVGILSAALKKGIISDEAYADMIRWTCMLNKVGSALAALPGVHAMTDVTGFGFCGHLLEMCRGAQLSATVNINDLPWIETARVYAEQGIATGASSRNFHSYGTDLVGAPPLEDWRTRLITDPQTSGGLLLACSPETLPAVQAEVMRAQGSEAWVVGRLTEGVAKVCIML